MPSHVQDATAASDRNRLESPGKWVLLAALLASCSPAPATPVAAADGGPEVSAADSARAAAPLTLHGPKPALFDCTAQGIPPTRRASVPLGCVLDPTCKQRLVVGHRGAGGEFARIAPENSLAGLRAALWMGYDGVEIDVRHTADDGLVLLHDGKVDRTTNGTGDVAKLTLAQATALGLKPTGQGSEPYPGDFTCEKVPTLAAALALVKGKVFVDLDCKTSRMDLVVPAIVQAGVIDQVFVSVSDYQVAVAARKLNPKIRVQIRPDTQDEFDAALAQFPERPPEIVEVPTDDVAAFAPKVAALPAALFANGFPRDVFAVAADLAGEPIDGSAYLKLYAAGARIVQTEFPGVVLGALGRTVGE